MPDNLVALAASGHVHAIRLCLSHGLEAPALILTFSAIDFVSALDRPADKPESQRSDFIAWVDRYMPSMEMLGVDGRDLYASRCTVVHALTAESRLQREGKVRRIAYRWEDTARHAECDVVIGAEALFDAFCEGLKAFGDAVEGDAARTALVRRRAAPLLPA